MFKRGWSAYVGATSLAQIVLLASPAPADAQLHLGPGQLVQADGIDITVPGYSVPSYVDWDQDALKDLVVGEGSGTCSGQADFTSAWVDLIGITSSDLDVGRDGVSERI